MSQPDIPDTAARIATIAAAVWSMTASTGLADTQSFIDMIVDRTAAFYCTTDQGKSAAFIFTQEADGTYVMSPDRRPARRNGGSFATDLDDGYLTISNSAFARLTKKGVETGPCIRIDYELFFYWDAIVAANRVEVQEYFNFYASLMQSVPTPNPADESSALAKANRAAERLRRENDKLKLEICRLNPDVTYSVCKTP